MQGFRKLWKPLLALVAVLSAFAVTFVVGSNGLSVDIDGSPRARAARNRDPYDLTQLQVLNRAILEVKRSYVEPDRIDPQRMLLAGLNAIQREVAPVIVRYEDGAGELTVQVNNEHRTFRVDDVTAPWEAAERFRDVFAFLQANLDGEDIELREIEYAAVNGMLRTLDPHTVLLTPEVFEEMQMSTRGEFGGLGIVISVREGNLTIIRPMANTPASRAGLERGDRIVKINEEATLNMPLSEAVNRLRGPPGSRVQVWVRRRGSGGNWAAPRRFELVRAVIHIESVEHRMLEDGIGYIKINNFQGNTHEDMQRALADLHRQRLQGLVLDLRDNPGGLLDQAVRVADTFLSSGTIVATSSRDPSQRDEKFARRENTEPDYPMAVLINGSSASASEIVAGALKNHDRALLIGQRSFGKGSVQVLYNFRDGSALKLTIAQYLTPGDVSIQGVGIVPDIAIDPMTVSRENMDLAADASSHVREADLRSHLTNERAREAQRPSTVLRYYLDQANRQRLDEAEPNEEENETEEEFLTSFSQALLSRASRSGRREMLADAETVIEETRREQMARATSELQRLGVDWSPGEDAGASTVEVEVSTNRPGNAAAAGEDFIMTVRVRNTGEHPLHQLRATTRSDYRLFGSREFVFGRLDPGATREWSSTLGICRSRDGNRTCRIPRDIADRADGIRLEFDEAHDHAPPSAELRTTVTALPRPQFAYSVQVADNIEGNGDGHLQRGEQATMYLRIKNVGAGRTYETQANLRNLSGRGVLLRDGRFRLDNMAPGDERMVSFTFEVLEDFERDEAKLEVSVVDLDLRIAVTEKVPVPIAAPQGTVVARSGTVHLGEGATVRAAPAADAEVLGRASAALTLPAQATSAGFVRVDLGDGQPGWVAEGELVDQRPSAGGAVAFELGHSPPRLEVDFGGALVTRESRVRIRGTAQDDSRVRDLYIFAGGRKVFYQSNSGGSDVRRAAFETEVPLHGGINYITVVVRESDDVVARRLVVIRRDDENGALMETPRYDDSLFGGTAP